MTNNTTKDADLENARPSGAAPTDPRILISCRDPELRSNIAAELAQDTRNIIVLAGADELREWMGDAILESRGKSEHPMPDLIVADQPDGLPLLFRLRQAGWETPFILLGRAKTSGLEKFVRDLSNAAMFRWPFEYYDLRTVAMLLVSHLRYVSPPSGATSGGMVSLQLVAA